MLLIADALAPTITSPLLPAVARIAVIMLYTCGLRRGELARLTLDDVEPKTGLLRIRASKFHKSSAGSAFLGCCRCLASLFATATHGSVRRQSIGSIAVLWSEWPPRIFGRRAGRDD